MNIAFLFNSNHKSLGGWYGYTVMKKLLEARVLQEADRHMRVSVGDILTYGAATRSQTPTKDYLIELCKAVYRPVHFDRLNHNLLENTHGKVTIYCWLFQNMTSLIADDLHAKLISEPAYLGAMDVLFSEPLHLSLFRNSLIENYRLHGRNCSIFHSMGENEDPDVSTADCFNEHGYVVSYEDIGARGTIFDNFDSLEHFRRIEDFKRVFASFNNLGEERASDLTLNLEEIHPKLFDAFASAARTLARAETDEDYAQAALSGRRLLEKIANYLFPASDDDWNGRKVGPSEYKNRLWAYIDQAISRSGSDKDALTLLGKEVDRLIELFNAGLHATPTKLKVESAFTSLVIWLSEVISLSPVSARRPYLAYEDSLEEFTKDIISHIKY